MRYMHTWLQEMGFFCPRRLRHLRLQQYSVSEQQRLGLPSQLTRNKFSKSAWKQWRSRQPAVSDHQVWQNVCELL